MTTLLASFARDIQASIMLHNVLKASLVKQAPSRERDRQIDELIECNAGLIRATNRMALLGGLAHRLEQAGIDWRILALGATGVEDALASIAELVKEAA